MELDGTHNPARTRRIVLYSISGACAVLLIAFIWVMDFGNWVALDVRKLTSLTQTTLLFDDNDKEIAGLYSGQNRIAIPLASVPEHVRQAFIAAEDARFYGHHGIDVWRIGGAVLSNIKSGGYSQGASTITQQLIKLTHLTQVKTLARKANEAWLALQLEREYSKDEILEMYLNTVYFGHGAYGIEAASRAYFSKSAPELTLDEGALLAATIKSPSGYAPHLKPDRALERRNLVLSEMAEQEFITGPEMAEAANLPITLHETKESLPAYGWFIDCALAEAADILDLTQEELLSSGYLIFTTLDTELQAHAEQVVATAEYPAAASDGTRCQVALSAVDTSNGALLCCVGGREYVTRRGLNRAVDIQRQPGSAIKPLAVYAPAINSFSYLPTSFLNDVPTDFDGYSPRNAGGNTRGIVTLRETVTHSINIPTVELLERIGVQSGISYLNSVGINTDPRDEYLPLALGAMTYGVSTTQLSAAYAPFANGGAYRQPYAVREIQTLDGSIVYKHTAQVRQVLAQTSAYIMTDMLESVIADGTGKRLSALKMPVAGKTGTAALESGGNRDAWIAAYTPRLSAAVWMGFDRTDSTHQLPASASGSNQPAKLMASFLSNVGGYAGGRFTRPNGVTEVALDRYALENEYEVRLASESTPANMLLRELFTTPQLPHEVTTLWDEPLPPRDLTVNWSDAGQPQLAFTCLQSNVEYIVERDMDGQREQVTTLSGEPGQRLTFVDNDVYGIQRVAYVITPHQPATNQTGVSSTGYIERSLWDSLGTILGDGYDEYMASTPEPDGIEPDASIDVLETPAPTAAPLPENPTANPSEADVPATESPTPSSSSNEPTPAETNEQTSEPEYTHAPAASSSESQSPTPKEAEPTTPAPEAEPALTPLFG